MFGKVFFGLALIQCMIDIVDMAPSKPVFTSDFVSGSLPQCNQVTLQDCDRIQDPFNKVQCQVYATIAKDHPNSKSVQVSGYSRFRTDTVVDEDGIHGFPGMAMIIDVVDTLMACVSKCEASNEPYSESTDLKAYKCLGPDNNMHRCVKMGHNSLGQKCYVSKESYMADYWTKRNRCRTINHKSGTFIDTHFPFLTIGISTKDDVRSEDNTRMCVLLPSSS